MALKEQDIVFTTKDESGNTIIQMPITRVENIEGTFSIEQGGTGATTAAEARENLGIVEVLFSILNRPKWAMALGDGSDGVFNPTADTTITGELNYTSVNIPSGVTVTVAKNAVIRCQGDFVNAGTISGVGTGGEGGARNGGTGEAGLTAGGIGGSGKGNSSGTSEGGTRGVGARFDNVDVYSITTLYGGGGGGGSYSSYNGVNGGIGGVGGAGLIVVSKTITHTGTIDLSGATGGTAGYSGADIRGGGGGGGGGGSAFFVAEDINNNGMFTSTGGAGGHGYNSPSRPTAGENGALYSFKIMEGVWM